MQDTSPAAEKRYFELLAAKSPMERLEITIRLCTVVRKLAEAGIRAQYPDASSDEVRAKLAERLYGRHVAMRLFPTVF